MSSLCDFFLSDNNNSLQYDGGPAYTDKCQFKSLSILEVAGILAVLNGGDAVELLDDFQLLTPEDAEEWIYLVPVEMTELLSNIDPSEIEEIAEKCAVETVEEIAWETSDFLPVITALRSLAVKARQLNKDLYVWNSL